MGMYTGLRCKVIIKPEFRPLIKKMMDERLDWEDIAGDYSFIKEFSTGFRADFIPYGGLSYMPDEWETNPNDWKNSEATDGFERQFDGNTGYWAFQCSLKNYENDIERFFELILENIAEKVIHLEYYYEEWTRSVFYELVDGKITRSEREGIKYGYEDDHDYGFWGIK